MKIICLIDSLGPGGAQRQLVGLSVQLRKHGWDVAVVIYHNNLFFSDDLLSNGVPYIYLQKANNKISRILSILLIVFFDITESISRKKISYT